MKKIGFYNWGTKVTQSLYFLNHTKALAVLIEVYFVDDKDDTKLYKNSKDAVAEATVIKSLK